MDHRTQTARNSRSWKAHMISSNYWPAFIDKKNDGGDDDDDNHNSHNNNARFLSERVLFDGGDGQFIPT